MQEYPYMVPYTWQLSFWWKGEQELAGKAWKKIKEKWNPQQIVMSRGEIVKENVPQVLTQAFAWVPPLPETPQEPKVDREALGRCVRGTYSTGGPSEGPNESEINTTLKDKEDESESTMMKDKPPMAMPKPKPALQKPVEEKSLTKTNPAEGSEEMAQPPPACTEPAQETGNELLG
jgi:hypothetical protein